MDSGNALKPTSALGIKQVMKPRPSLLPAAGILQLAKLMTAAESKYPGPKWMDISPGGHVDAAMRHLLSHLAGDTVDRDFGFTNLTAAAVRLLMAVDRQYRESHGEPVESDADVVARWRAPSGGCGND